MSPEVVWTGAVVAAAVAAVAVYVVGSLSGWWIRRRTVEELIALLEPAIRVYKPEGKGPFPAVIQLHGCGGARPNQDEHARAAQGVGVLAVVLDSFTPRGIDFEKAVKTVCPGYRLRGRERAGDLVAGLEMLRRRKDVDPKRLAVAGWSHGSWTIMDLLALDTPREKPFNLRDCPEDVWAGVRGVELIYPYSGFPALTRERGWARTDIPADVFLVTDDVLADENETLKALEKPRARGAHIEVETWTGVTHGFDEMDQRAGSPLRYDPARAAKLHKRYAAWLKRTLEV